jgi:hypothetical protein
VQQAALQKQQEQLRMQSQLNETGIALPIADMIQSPMFGKNMVVMIMVAVFTFTIINSMMKWWKW